VPKDTKGKPPAVVMVAQAGKAAFLKERSDVLTAFLKAGVAVCLVDVRGTGETRPGNGSADRSSSRTSISQTELILGQTVLGNQLRDLRAAVRWLGARTDLDSTKVAVWGDSFAESNPSTRNQLVPLDAPDPPAIAEPGAALLARLAGLYEDRVTVVFANGGLTDYQAILSSAYLHVPHDAIVPGTILIGDVQGIRFALGFTWVSGGAAVDGWNWEVRERTVPLDISAMWVAELLNRK